MTSRNPHLDLVFFLGVFGVGIALFFAAWMAFQKPRRQAPWLLAMLLVALASSLWYEISVHSKLIYQFPWLFGMRGAIDMIVFPVLYLYVLARTSRDFRVKLVHCVLFIPFIVLFIVELARYGIQDIETKVAMIDAFYANSRPGPTNTFTNAVFFAQYLLFPAVLITLAVIRMVQYRSSSKNTHRGLAPLLLLVAGAGALKLFNSVVYYAVYRVTGKEISEWAINSILIACVILTIAVIVLRRLEDVDVEQKKYGGSSLSDETAKSIVDSVRIALESDDLFKIQGLSLQSLADKIDVNQTYLSQAINSQLDMSFSEYVNEYRIREAERMLVSDDYANLSVEGIATEVGFRSRSAFYRAFKQKTGMTPSQFRANRA